MLATFHSVSNFNIPSPLPSFFLSFFYPFLFRPCHPCPPITKLCSTRDAASKTMSQAIRAFLVRFFETIVITEFCARSNVGRLNVMQFQKQTMPSNIIPAKKATNLIRAEAIARSKPLKRTMFASLLDPNLQEIGPEHNR